MENRLRLLQATTALLYLGPLLAGLAGQGWVMVPLFTAIFVLWSMILRPHLWPASPRDFVTAEAAVALAALVATQALLVALCFALGRGLGGVMGLRPALPPYLPAALSFLSVPLSRLVWNPHRTSTLAGFDPLIHRPGPSARPPEALAATLLANVMALPDAVDEATVQSHLTAIAAHVDALVIRRTLQQAAAHPMATAATRKALIVHATDPDVAELLSGSGYPAEAFILAGTDADLMILFATRCARVVEDDPQLAPDCPTIAALTDAAQLTASQMTASQLTGAQSASSPSGALSTGTQTIGVQTIGNEAQSAVLRLAGLLGQTARTKT